MQQWKILLRNNIQSKKGTICPYNEPKKEHTSNSSSNFLENCKKTLARSIEDIPGEGTFRNFCKKILFSIAPDKRLYCNKFLIKRIQRFISV